jgi:chemotaxis signal transduction protein
MESRDASPFRPWCLFKSDSRPFAVGLDAVAEVVEADRLVRLSQCPPQVLGLCAVRRDIVPVLCLNPRPRAAERAAEGKYMVLILKTEQGTWGVRIDREGTTVTEGALDDEEPIASAGDGPAIIGQLTRADAVHAVIDPRRTWRNVREHVERWYRR